MKVRTRSALSVVICLAQIGAGVMLYRYRVTHHDWQAGDAIVLYLPPAAAFAAQILLRTFRPGIGRVAAIAAGLAALSFFLTMLVNLNVYGS